MRSVFKRAAFRILNLTIVKEYYRQNAVFIFAVMLFTFGFLRSSEHITLIKLALKSPSLLALIFLIWAMHALKVILFSLRMFKSKPNEFLYNIRLFSPIKRFLAFGLMQFSLLQLTLLYSLWMIKIGIEEQAYLESSAIIICNFILILTGILIYEYRINRPNTVSITVKPMQSLLAKFRTPDYLFFIRFLFAKQPVLLLSTKFFGCFVLIGICNLYPTDAYDERLLALSGLFVAAGHSVFCLQYFNFELQYLSFNRNLPISSMRRILCYLLAYSILLLPESIVLVRNLPLAVSFIFALALLIFILSMIFLLHHIQFISSISKDNFLKGAFFTGIMFLLLIMFQIPVILMAAVNFSVAIFVFKKHYYESELSDS